MQSQQFIKVGNVPEFISKSRDIKKRIATLKGGDWLYDLVAIGEDAKKTLQDETPKKTGNLARSWRVSRNKVDKGQSYGITVHNSKEDDKPPVLAYLEFGTPQHIIRPKKEGGWLIFKTKEGNWIKTKEVHHPGFPPYAMVARTRDKYEPQFKRIADRWLQQIVTIWEGK